MFFFFRNVCHSLRSIGRQLLLSTTACSGQPSAGACFSKVPKSFWTPESHNKTSSQTLSPQSCSFLVFLISTKFPCMQSSMPIHTTLVKNGLAGPKPFRGFRVTGRLRVVSNFGDSDEIHARARKWAPSRRRATRRGASPRGSPFSRARLNFAGIAKIRDYSQSKKRAPGALSI